jgi:hypothetical protein
MTEISDLYRQGTLYLTISILSYYIFNYISNYLYLYLSIYLSIYCVDEDLLSHMSLNRNEIAQLQATEKHIGVYLSIYLQYTKTHIGV